MAEEGDIEIGEGRGEEISIQIARGSGGKEGRHSPLSDLSGEHEHAPEVITQIGAARRGSFKNLDDHAGMVDPLGEGGEYGESAQKEDDLKIGTVRGGGGAS
jgi:hypothetical protein